MGVYNIYNTYLVFFPPQIISKAKIIPAFKNTKLGPNYTALQYSYTKKDKYHSFFDG